MDQMKVLTKTLKLCQENGVTLLYLSTFGSHLYGLNTENSDYDFKGIFLPSTEMCYVGNMPKSLHYSSGKNDSKNTAEDIDIDLWSLQYFLSLVKKGETNALDLLYSSSNVPMVIYSHWQLDSFIQHKHGKLYDLKSCNAYIGYAVGQAAKYGIKGSRLGVIKNVLEYTKKYFPDAPKKYIDKKINNLIPILVEHFYDNSYCFAKKINGKLSLVLCGKVHEENISVYEFINRIQRTYDHYGERAKLAEKNQGVDWKALSHALRSIYQMKSLIQKGRIKFPFVEERKMLMDIKQGKIDFLEASKIISDGIEEVKEQLKYVESNKPINTKDFICSFY